MHFKSTLTILASALLMFSLSACSNKSNSSNSSKASSSAVMLTKADLVKKFDQSANAQADAINAYLDGFQKTTNEATTQSNLQKAAKTINQADKNLNGQTSFNNAASDLQKYNNLSQQMISEFEDHRSTTFAKTLDKQSQYTVQLKQKLGASLNNAKLTHALQRWNNVANAAKEASTSAQQSGK